MVKALEWGLATALWMMSGYTLYLELWTHGIILVVFSIAATYLNIEPFLMRLGLKNGSVIDSMFKN